MLIVYILSIIVLSIILIIVTLYKKSLNSLIYFKSLYIILRDNANIKTPTLSKGFMRQTSQPWMVGTGLNIRINRYLLQIGFCKPSKHTNEESGLLGALGGRLMDTNVSEIREW